MTRRFLACCLVAIPTPAPASAQSALEPVGDRLSLQHAIRIALENNRPLKSARLQSDKAEADLEAARTHRLPSFQTEVTMSQLLTPVDFAFPKGAFGDFPATGPIPAADSTISVPQQPTAYVFAEVSQPLSQLFRIGLSVQNATVARDVEREHVRAQQLSLVNGIKRQYF